jgi:hypothetical protein
MIRVPNEIGSDGIEEVGTHGIIPENGVYQIIHAKDSLLLGVYVDPIIYFGPRRIVPPGARIAIETSLALAVFEDHHLPVKAVGVLKNPMNQSPQDVGVRCTAALPLAVYLDEHHVVGIDDTFGPSPRMATIGSVKLHPVFRKQIQQGIQAPVTELTVMYRA